jgi:putative endonuclease
MDDRERKQVGKAAEDSALAHLRAVGLRLIVRNYRCRAGEIDLVMLDGNVLALVEVRYRGSDAFGGAAASVTSRKQRRLVLAARHLLMCRAELRSYPARFDVIAVAPGPSGQQTIEWIRQAFTL